MRCVITGVAGFVGSSIADFLLANGHTVVGIDCFVDYYPAEIKMRNLAGALGSPNFKLVKENLLHADLPALLDGSEWIFHQAAQAGVRASWGQYFNTYCDNNILATQRLLEAARSSGAIKKIVYASSSSVYGNAEAFPTREEMLPRPTSPYGVTKLAAEHLMCQYAGEFGLPTVSLRYFTVFGPRQRPEMAFHKFIKAALEGEEIVVYGDGEQSRDFTFIADIVQANHLAALEGSPGDVFNIGGGTQASINQVLELLGGQIGKLKVRREERQAGDARHTSADTTRARAKLGFEPKFSLEEGLRRQIAWIDEQLKR